MIKNEKQYKITKKLLSQWEENLRLLLSGVGADRPEWLYKEWLRGTKEEIRQLKNQLKEYETTKAGKEKLPDLKVVEELPKLLVKWRIARRLTQKQLADKLHIHENQVQRYENSNYAGASLTTIRNVAHILSQLPSEKLHKLRLRRRSV